MRPVVGLLGVVAAVVPERMVDVFEAVAVENPGECTVRPWIAPGRRAEGVVVAVASLVGGRPYAWLVYLTGAFGAALLLAPRLYRELATGLLHEDSEGVEWNEQFTDGVRIIGVMYVLTAVREFVDRRADA